MIWFFKILQYRCHLNNIRNVTLLERGLFSLLHFGEDTAVCVTKCEASETETVALVGWKNKLSTISTSTATHIHRPLPSAPASLERDFSTIFNNYIFQTLLAAFFHRIYELTNLSTFWDKPYGSVRRCHQCCPASTRSVSPGTVLPLSASVLCSEMGGREAVQSAGHTAAEPSVKEYKTAFPSTCHLRTVWSYKYEHRLSVNIMVIYLFFVTQTQAVHCQNHHNRSLV